MAPASTRPCEAVTGAGSNDDEQRRGHAVDDPSLLAGAGRAGVRGPRLEEEHKL